MGGGDVNWIAVLIAFVSSAGFGVVVKTAYDGFRLHRQGVSGREDRRKADIVAQRDHAIARMEKAEVVADGERRRRIIYMEECARLRLLVIEHGGNPGPRFIDESTHPT